MNLGSEDFHKGYVALKTHRYGGGALASGRMKNQVGITPFVYCYAEINFKSV